MATAPMITAHSGCDGTNRDSLDSVLRAIELGVDAVEVDVRKSPDGILRISHDKKLTAEQYASHATLEEVFRLLRPTSLSINCDVKEREHLYTLLNLAKQYGFGKERL
ncbi:MAG: glycerophosphodiester phosphodiesterase family protein, partial [Sphaerochaetaceae bacterium]